MEYFSLSQPPVVVFSHLRWEFVTQRPQHLMKRFSKHAQVLFVEESIPSDRKSPAHIFSPSKNITVMQPIVSSDKYTIQVGKLIRNFMKQNKWDTPRLWFYSAMFVDMLYQVPHTQVIYDCMDELSAFLGAPESLVMNERLLLSKADTVFTGGKSLYESKRRLHDHVHCFPSSVDKHHFEKALVSKKTSSPKDIERIPGKKVGFYGVIDERIDLNLLQELAVLNPDISFIMIGPVVKIAVNSLPNQKNIFYLGGKSYDQLPQYLKEFDIAMMPFALNNSTKFISPTKTLEFMAAKKPIISTPITDVAKIYPQEVTIAENSLEFSKAIRAYLAESVAAKKTREHRQTIVIDQTSWDATAKEMESIMTKTELAKAATKSERVEQPVFQYSV